MSIGAVDCLPHAAAAIDLSGDFPKRVAGADCVDSPCFFGLPVIVGQSRAAKGMFFIFGDPLCFSFSLFSDDDRFGLFYFSANQLRSAGAIPKTH